PLRGGFCWFFASRDETLFANDPNPNSFDDSQNLSDYSPQPQYETYPCELCGNDSHYGYDCSPQFSFIYEQESSYNQNYNENYYPHNSPSFLCCDNCGGPHESFQCQPMNQNYFEPNPCYDFNSFDFDQFQPPQYSDVHQPSKEISIDELKIMMQSYCERMNQQREQEALQAAQREQELRDKSKQLKKRKNHHKTPTFVNLLEKYEVIKSSVENLVPIPSESEGILDHKGDVPFSDKNHFDAESDLIESFLTRDTLIVYSSKIDSLLEEFVGELAHIDPIPLRIDETDSDPKDGIHFIEQLLYDDTSSEDDSFEGIDYVEVSPPDSELVSLEVVQDDILREKLLNIHLLIDKIESLNNNPTPDCALKSLSSYFLSYSDNSLPESRLLAIIRKRRVVAVPLLIAQQDEEANNSWDNMEAMMDADRLLVERLQSREREEFFEVQKARFTKRTAKHLEFDISKKQKVDENVEPVIDDSKELKKCMKIVPDDEDEVLIEATPLSSRSPTIIDYKIHKEGKKTYFKIIRADGNSQV
nr:hypothetical protein [Tanacetum cinerariifolium]